MNWDFWILIANIVITVISAYGALKSRNYYKKTKHLGNFNSLRYCLDEINKVKNAWNEVLKLVGEYNGATKGKNFDRIVSDKLNISINCLENVLREIPSDRHSDLVNKSKIGSRTLGICLKELISIGKIEKVKEFVDYNNAFVDYAFNEIQKYLKSAIDAEAEKLK